MTAILTEETPARASSARGFASMDAPYSAKLHAKAGEVSLRKSVVFHAIQNLQQRRAVRAAIAFRPISGASHAIGRSPPKQAARVVSVRARQKTAVQK